MTPAELAHRRPRAVVYVSGTAGMFSKLLPTIEELEQVKAHAWAFSDDRKLERFELGDPGTTVYFKNVGRRLPALSDYADMLSGAGGFGSVEVALVLSYGGRGFGAHRDPTDLLVMQLSGAKCWWLEGDREITMVDGDLLFLPRATLHECQSDVPSAHATFQLM